MGATRNYLFYGYDAEELKKIETLHKPKNVKFENLDYKLDLNNTTDNLIDKYISEKINNSVIILDLDKFENLNIKKTIEFFKFITESLGLKSVFVTNNSNLLKKSFIKEIPNISKANNKQLFEILEKMSEKDFKYKFLQKKFFESLILSKKNRSKLNQELINHLEIVWHNMPPSSKLLYKKILEVNSKNLNFEQKLKIKIALKINRLEELLKKKNAFPKKQLDEMMTQYVTLKKHNEILQTKPNSLEARKIITKYKQRIEPKKSKVPKNKLHNSFKIRRGRK
ncbi:MAG: hypothetical protein WCY27_00610 [archaeon]|nr:hypothetical protein [archaeon]MDD2477370.1 hypothetical protein [Candidatus ainarchaeum sp.]MDD3084517.1 hypothetical protein [Candidatus ainarchaeum sp.]MDD4220798.1 hypothetical protein [Candidatus ainarchaeum sp.]